jgi:AcrR family transcriptional regulator
MAEEKLDTEIRREQIAEAALSLVADQGLRRLSIAAVARRVGLVPSGIYRHFKSKDEILDAVLERVEQRLLANVEAARREHSEPIACLKDVLMRHIRFIREGKLFSIPRVVFSDDVRIGNHKRRQRVLQVFSRYIGQVGQIVQLGQSQGCIRSDFDERTITMMLFGIILPAGILWHITEGGFEITQHAQRAWQLFVAAITNQANTPVSQRCE